MPNSAVPRSVPNSVAPSAKQSVDYLTGPQRGTLNASTGSTIVPVVPRAEGSPDPAEITPNPSMGSATAIVGTERHSGSSGAPSVPSAEFSGGLFPNGPIDDHYRSEYQETDPYAKVNNPPTRGMYTFVKGYINGIFTSQDKDNAGWNVRHPQQRTSWMRVTPPPHGAGYAPEIYEPKQQPQNVNTYKFNRALGTEPYGNGIPRPSGGGFQLGRVLNSDTYGAGQTAGGIGGNQYTPTPGPPETNSTAGRPDNSGGMPTWG